MRRNIKNPIRKESCSRTDEIKRFGEEAIEKQVSKETVEHCEEIDQSLSEIDMLTDKIKELLQ